MSQSWVRGDLVGLGRFDVKQMIAEGDFIERPLVPTLQVSEPARLRCGNESRRYPNFVRMIPKSYVSA